MPGGHPQAVLPPLAWPVFRSISAFCRRTPRLPRPGQAMYELRTPCAISACLPPAQIISGGGAAGTATVAVANNPATYDSPAPRGAIENRPEESQVSRIWARSLAIMPSGAGRGSGNQVIGSAHPRPRSYNDLRIAGSDNA